MEESLRIFAFEYATGGGCLESPSLAGCRAEGRAMLRQLITDLVDLPGIAVDAVIDEEDWPVPATQVHRIRSALEARSAWQRLVGATDLFWPIAPESAGILATIVAMAAQNGRRALASDSRAIDVAARKSATAQLLERRGIPCVPTLPADEAIPRSTDGWVVKPDDGIGCDDTWYFATRDAVRRWQDAEHRAGDVIQPFVPGTPLSLSILAQDGEAWVLTCNIQDVRKDRGAFSYHGGWTGGAEHRREALEPLATAIAAALPGLWGYIGIDLVDGRNGPIVLEINPRLTTSYAGLRASIGRNPAELVLAMIEKPLAQLRQPLAPRSVRVESGI